MEQTPWQQLWQWGIGQGLAVLITLLVIYALWRTGNWVTNTVWPIIVAFLEGLRSDHREGMDKIDQSIQASNATQSSFRTDIVHVGEQMKDVKEELREIKRDVRLEAETTRHEFHARFNQQAGYEGPERRSYARAVKPPPAESTVAKTESEV